MTSISIIGIGNMGSAITGIAAKSGAQVQVVARDLAKAQELAGGTGASAATFGEPLTGDIVVLALPFRPVAILGTQSVARLRSSVAALSVHLDRADCYRIIEASEGVPLP